MENFSAAPSAPVDPGGPDDLETDPKEQYRKLGLEISKLSPAEKFDKVYGFLRRNAKVCVDYKELALQLKYVCPRTLTTWMSEIRNPAPVQPLVPTVAQVMGVGMALPCPYMAPLFTQAVGQVSALTPFPKFRLFSYPLTPRSLDSEFRNRWRLN